MYRKPLFWIILIIIIAILWFVFMGRHRTVTVTPDTTTPAATTPVTTPAPAAPATTPKTSQADTSKDQSAA